ncbi:MAG: GNAT family N-acetyltransferase [Clostridium sp.]|nr:GNAT family N-acetyltransferase [Clostridium sp.]
MAIAFLPVIDAEGISNVAKMADEVYHEHYVDIISKEQIDYMVEHYQSVEAITEQIHKEGIDYFILNNEEADIGYFAIKIEEEHLFISKFYILKEYRKKGYGKQAYQFVKGLSEAMDLKYVFLYTHKKNEDSITAYEKLGMKKVESLVNDFGNGYVMDDYRMQVDL